MKPRETLIEWLDNVTHWTTKMDMTFEQNCNEFQAAKEFKTWMTKNLPSSTYMYAIEQDPNQRKVKTGQGINQSCHIHAISDTNWDILLEKKGIYRRDLHKSWLKQYGRNKIEPAKCVQDATNYALKQVLNYSKAREDTRSHVRKTDVDWALVFGKGKYAAKAKKKQKR